jgi:4-hydroxyphenylpyruvate dioxygenase-like putative hemolysin
MKPVFTNISKLSIVVNSVDETVRTYADIFGIGPWTIWEYNSQTVTEMIVNEEKAEYAARIARCKIGKVVWEIIQPLDQTGACADFLRQHGEGIHHLGYDVADFDSAMAFFRNKGKVMVQAGKWLGKEDFVYWDCGDELKHIVEITFQEPGFQYPDLLEVYPPRRAQDSISSPFITDVVQIGIVVKDIKRTAMTYNDQYGLGPWEFYEFNSSTVQDMNIDEQMVEHSFTTAATTIGNVELEFMEPHDDKNIYTRFFTRHGEGLQHVNFSYRDSFEDTMAFYRKQGYKVKQGGYWYGCTFVYMGSEKDLKVPAEAYGLIPGFVRPPSDFAYPAKK